MYAVFCFSYKMIWTYMTSLHLCLSVYCIQFYLIVCLVYTLVLRSENFPLLLLHFFLSDLPFLDRLYLSLYFHLILSLGIFLIEHHHIYQNMFLSFSLHQILYQVSDLLLLLGNYMVFYVSFLLMVLCQSWHYIHTGIYISDLITEN